jgi:D-alanyl-lipoteichoic acid acyltransferase DltB (MBOAT superfamily)
MIAIGLWHEFAVRYLVWGGYHAFGLAAHRWYAGRRERPRIGRLRRLGSTAFTAVFVMVGFTITRSASIGDMAEEFRNLIVGGW